MVVSHDNFFVNRVAEHLFVFEGDGVVRDFQGSYTDYLDYRSDMADLKRQEQNDKRKEASAAASAASSGAQKASSAVLAPVAVPVDAVLPTKEDKTKGAAKGGALNYTDRKEMNKLEKEIEKLGQQISKYEDQLATCKEGYTVLAGLTKEMNVLVGQRAAKEERWVELADMDAGDGR